MGRKATEREKEQETPVLKDLDFIEGTTLNGVELPPTYLKIGMKKRAVLSQLTVDVKYLEQLHIMVTHSALQTLQLQQRRLTPSLPLLLMMRLLVRLLWLTVVVVCRITRCWSVSTTKIGSGKPKRRRLAVRMEMNIGRGKDDE